MRLSFWPAKGESPAACYEVRDRECDDGRKLGPSRIVPLRGRAAARTGSHCAEPGQAGRLHRRDSPDPAQELPRLPQRPGHRRRTEPRDSRDHRQGRRERRSDRAGRRRQKPVDGAYPEGRETVHAAPPQQGQRQTTHAPAAWPDPALDQRRREGRGTAGAAGIELAPDPFHAQADLQRGHLAGRPIRCLRTGQPDFCLPPAHRPLGGAPGRPRLGQWQTRRARRTSRCCAIAYLQP